MTIYEKAVQQMNSKDIDHNSLGSDLYLRVNDISRKLVEEYEFKDHVKTFKDNIEHVLWYEIPFAYDQFWKDKEQTKPI